MPSFVIFGFPRKIKEKLYVCDAVKVSITAAKTELLEKFGVDCVPKETAFWQTALHFKTTLLCSALQSQMG